MLAIGDGVETDVRGAVQSEIDVLFVAGGIHAELFGERNQPAAESDRLVPRPQRPRRAGVRRAPHLVTGVRFSVFGFRV